MGQAFSPVHLLCIIPTQGYKTTSWPFPFNLGQSRDAFCGNSPFGATQRMYARCPYTTSWKDLIRFPYRLFCVWFMELCRQTPKDRTKQIVRYRWLKMSQRWTSQMSLPNFLWALPRLSFPNQWAAIATGKTGQSPRSRLVDPSRRSVVLVVLVLRWAGSCDGFGARVLPPRRHQTITTLLYRLSRCDTLIVSTTQHTTETPRAGTSITVLITTNRSCLEAI